MRIHNMLSNGGVPRVKRQDERKKAGTRKVGMMELERADREGSAWGGRDKKKKTKLKKYNWERKR